ncbi:MAG: lipoyl synthase [Desulfuromonadales bacterium]|nr:lipoyl synthase [Desulfuromonadales bacterium]MBN2792200.1 lipoyl synthase [Desulfuromonadales bacterium]
MKNHLRKPDWLKVKFPAGESYTRIDRYHRMNGLHSVCRSAACPNQGECWSKGTATFMILGDTCSRHCRFCNVGSGPLSPPDPEEPAKVAAAIVELNLKHAVITSVTRDDLDDGGAVQFAQLIREIRRRTSDCRIELLIPDLQGDRDALATILKEKPDILGHNVETVPRLYSRVRPEAIYQRTLDVLAEVKRQDPAIITKSGLMLGMGETREEVLEVMADLRKHQCQLLTLGQYLAPTREHFPVARYVTPDEFAALAVDGKRLGFDHVESGPLVRSSYHAEEQYQASQGGEHG